MFDGLSRRQIITAVAAVGVVVLVIVGVIVGFAGRGSGSATAAPTVTVTQLVDPAASSGTGSSGTPSADTEPPTGTPTPIPEDPLGVARAFAAAFSEYPAADADPVHFWLTGFRAYATPAFVTYATAHASSYNPLAARGFSTINATVASASVVRQGNGSEVVRATVARQKFNTHNDGPGSSSADRVVWDITVSTQQPARVAAVAAVGAASR